MAVKQLPNRADVPKPLTWDLTKIFKTDQEFETEFKNVSNSLSELAPLKQSMPTSGQALLNGIEKILSIERHLEKVYVYASLKSDQDTSNSTYQAYDAKAGQLAANFGAEAAFLEPTILSIDPKTLADYQANTPGLAQYAQFLKDITDNRPHVLSSTEEGLIAKASDALNASSRTFDLLSDSDLKFPVVKDDDGQDVQLTDGVYSQLIRSSKPEVRKQAFKALYQVYGQFKNTFSSTLSGEMKRHNYFASVHHFDSARQAAMSSNHIPEAVYDTLVTTVNQHLDLLHRYTRLRKKVLGLNELHMYDLYTPLTGQPELMYNLESAKKTALDALAIMGPDYLQHVKDIFSNRDIDVVENKGKRSGAYSGGSYDTDPYILLNWQDDLDNLYTLVHETGHSVHSWYARHNQPYVYGDYAIFVAEIASTTNENILTDYLLKTQTDPKVRAYILNYYLDGFKGTVFRQTQFAEFEQLIHEADQNGQPLTSAFLNEKYGAINGKYYGKDVVNDPEIALEWARIPHFYMNYYVYQYATGFAAASSLAQGITTDQPHAKENYLAYLKAGSSDDPIQIMQKAGVDMTQSDYLESAFQVFEERLNELEKLVTK